MRAWVAVTDKDWFRFLAQRPHLEEVNFWQPGGSRAFGTLQPGEPFLFKLHYPDNTIVGGGFFTHASVVPVSVAWDAFGEKNGAVSYEEMRRRIERYRRVPADPRAQYSVGCIILQEPFFFPEADWLPAPADFRMQTVQGKTYDLNEPMGHGLWQAILERWRGVRPTAVAEPPRPEIPLDWRTRPVRLLRSDLHALFDQGYMTVTPDHRVRVSQRLKTDFDDGEPYYPLAGRTIRLPGREGDHPNREHLEWHVDTVFLG